MRHDFLDRYSRLASPMHRLPAELKLGVALGLVLVIVVLPLAAWPWFAAVAMLLAGAAAASRVPPRFLAGRLLLLEPLVLGAALLALFQPGGLVAFGTLVLKTTLCLSTMLLLSSTTPFSEILRVLRRARMPALLVTTLALMYRYLFVLSDEAQRMRAARTSRTFTRRRASMWRALGTVIAQLFVRSTERAERIYVAMCARGWR